MKRISIALAALPAFILSVSIPPTAEARYPDDFDGHYDDLQCAEDDCDCLEPDSNRFKVVSPSNLPNTGDTIVFTGAYDQVQGFFEAAGQTDGLPIVPPTALKVEKFMRYTPSSTNGAIATLNGREVVNAFREDVVRPSMDREAALANAPARTGDEFMLPKIVEGAES